jgi:hypothetical protein
MTILWEFEEKHPKNKLALMGRSPFQRFCSAGKRLLAPARPPVQRAKALEKYRFRPMVPDFLHGAPPTGACAAFIKESRMKFVNARELDRKSGCTLGRTWDTRPEP